MAKENVKTFHLLKVAESLVKQNVAVLKLVMAAQTVLKVDDLNSRRNLELAILECRAIMFPHEDEG